MNEGSTYLELRILTYLECEEKMKKITHILNFLQANNFLVNLTVVYYNVLRAENIPEQQDIASLTLDMRDNKFRFKFWDGSKTYWTYHLSDLFKILIDSRNEFIALTDKYKSITDLLYSFVKKDKNIKSIRYQYYPSTNIDIQYSILFKKDAENKNVVNFIMKDIFEQINNLNIEDLNLKMDIDYSFEKECIPCQKRKEQKE